MAAFRSGPPDAFILSPSMCCWFIHARRSGQVGATAYGGKSLSIADCYAKITRFKKKEKRKVFTILTLLLVFSSKTRRAKIQNPVGLPNPIGLSWVYCAHMH